VHVDGQYHSAGCNFGGFEIQEFWLNELELANAVSNIIDLWDLVGIQDSEEPLNELHWAWEVEVETHFDKDLGLNICERFFVNILLFFVGQKIYHSCKTWRNRLL
jgi:hypothetical protein